VIERAPGGASSKQASRNRHRPRWPGRRPTGTHPATAKDNRIGVAKGKFLVPEDIDADDVAVAALINGTVA
jgi:hypothetical protein